MNLSLPNSSSRLESPWRPSLSRDEDSKSTFVVAHLRQLRSLVSLFALYTTTLFVISFIGKSEDVGCILTGIAGHVLYASAKLAFAWRDAALLEELRHSSR